MCKLYVLASIPNQGKTTTSILLGEYFQKQGQKTAHLQIEKGYFDVHPYLEKNCFHYSIPLEAAKTRKSFERWLPKGYDVYILEISFSYSPIGVAFVDLFENVNEIISFNLKDSWDDFVLYRLYKDWEKENIPDSHVSAIRDRFYERNVKKVLTKTPGEHEEASVDELFVIHHPEQFVSNMVNPEYTFPTVRKSAIAVGVFPAEYWDIYPELKWYHYDYSSFMKRYRRDNFGIAIIGISGAEDMKFTFKPEHGEVICYQPSVYLEGAKNESHGYLPLVDDLLSVYRAIKNEPVGTPIGKDGGCYSPYNNKYWIFNSNQRADLVVKDKNIIFCHGWVLPQYLIRDGYLEVN